MTTPRFFVQSPVAVGQAAALDPEQTRQVRNTLRMRTGDALVVFDGSGREGHAQVSSMRKDSVEYTVIRVDTPRREPPLALDVALAVLRGERFELAVQKLTEVGVRSIIPLLTERTVVSFEAAADWERRAARLQRIAREAAEQSERVTLPHIAAPLPLPELLTRRAITCLVERDTAPPLASIPLAEVTTIAIGPEGGWSPRERALVRAADVQIASMGSLVLRAETAAIVAAGTLLQRAWHEYR